MSVDDVRWFHERMLRPADATLLVVGDCDHGIVRRLAVEAFAGWTGNSDQLPAAAVVPTPPRLNLVHRPGAQQSELRIGHVAVARSTPDYHPLVVANMVLGGQFVSRLNLKLREEKGFTYGARTAFDFRRLPGPFVFQAGVQTAATAEAITDSLDEITAFCNSRPATEAELALGVAALTRGYARNFETAEQVARAITQIALYDLPDDYYVQFVPQVSRVTTEDLARVAREHLDPSRLTTLVVGDYEAIGPSLRGLNLGEPSVLSADAF
jgi:predicted Zn-dependent peptidase